MISGLALFTAAVSASLLVLLGHVDSNIRYSSDDKNAEWPKPAGRTLVILVDSLRKDFMFDSEVMPFLNSLVQRSAVGSAKILSNPITIAGDKSIFSGRIDNSAWSLAEDFSGSNYAHDNIFRRLMDAKRTAAILSSDTIKKAFNAYEVGPSFKASGSKFNEYTEEASYVFENSRDYLVKEKWDFAALQFVSVDFAGHLHTPRSSEYRDMVRKIDEYISELIPLLGPDDTVLITAEHGMDDNGCHIDNKEMTVETPFLIFGPRVRKGARAEIMQIDWAPTLSLLSGVSPFYDGVSLPAYRILDTEDLDGRILPTYSKSFGLPQTGSYESLDSWRMTLLGVKKRPWFSALICLTLCISLTLLYAAVFFRGDTDEPCDGQATAKAPRLSLKLALAAITSVTILPTLFSISGLWNFISDEIPFRADFIIGHPFLSIGFLACLAGFPFICWRYFLKDWIGNAHDTALFFCCMAAIPSASMVENPYYSLCWAVLASILAGWFLTRSAGWLLLFISICAGFSLRRLTYITLFHELAIPERSTVICLLSAAFAVVIFARDILARRNAAVRIPVVFLAVFPCAVVKFLPLEASYCGAALILCLIPLVLVFRRDKDELALALSYWMGAYYMGTSSSLGTLSLAVSFPVLAGVWMAKADSPVSKGILAWAAIWSLYLIPGNAFGYRLVELIDPFIMSSAQVKNIAPCVLIIASHYILPITLIFIMIGLKGGWKALAPVALITIFPSAWVLGAKLCILAFNGSQAYPWEEVERITVFAISIIIRLVAAAAAWAVLRSLAAWRPLLGPIDRP